MFPISSEEVRGIDGEDKDWGGREEKIGEGEKEYMKGK